MARQRPRRTPPIEVNESAADAASSNARSYRNIFLGVFFAAFLVVGCIGYLQYSTNRRLVQLEQYVADAKVKRDAQNQAINEALDEAACRFLDRLPAGPLWDPMREQYGCGPGIAPGNYQGAATALTPREFYQAFPDPLN